MASLVLGAIGGAFFGPIGFAIGSAIGSLLFPPKGADGPRLDNLKLSTSAYGQPIPLTYGTMRVPGNVIWQTDLEEHKSGGGKGGSEPTTYTYSASFAIYLCANEIASVTKIWADGTLLWALDGTAGDGAIPCVVYTGTETQLPDPTMEAVEGVGNIPGYRGTAYVVFADYFLTDFGNRIPNLNFEVLTKGQPDAPIQLVAAITEDTPWPGGMYITEWNTGFPADTTFADPTGLDGPLAYISFINGLCPGALCRSYFCLPVGPYKYADDSSIYLWYCVNPYNGVGGVDVQLSIGPQFLSGNNCGGVDFASAAGIPAGLYIGSVVLTADSKSAFVMTINPLNIGGGVCTQWFRVTDGVVVDNGTIVGGGAGGGISGTTFGVGNGSVRYSQVASMFENNGLYCWSYVGNVAWANPPIVDPSLVPASIGIFKIDPSTKILAFYPTTFYGGPMDIGGVRGSIFITQEGYAGVIGASSTKLFTRLGPDAPTYLYEIVDDLSARAGLTTPQLDTTALTDVVDGYLITQQQSSRDCITPLQSAFYFDAVESSGVMRFVKRGGASVITIPDDDLAAQADMGESPPLITVVRAQEVDLPAVMNIRYVNAANDYQTGTQISQRQVTESQLESTLDLPINMTDLKAKQVANTLLFNPWVERMSFIALAPRKYAYLEPTDVLTAGGFEMRIANKTDVASNIEQFDGVAAVTELWSQAPTPVGGSGFTPSTPTTSQPTQMQLLDIPLIVDTDDQNGIYAALAGNNTDTWSGAALYKSIDAGASYQSVASTNVPNVIGTASNALGDFAGGNVFDEINTVTLVVGAGGGELESVDELAVLNGANVFLIGNEIVQAKNCVLTDTNTYLLSGLLRGRRGTEFTTANHVAGETFVALPALNVDGPFSELGQVREYKPVSFGQSIAGTTATDFINTGNKIRPYSPVDLGGGVNDTGDVTINWTKRTRVGGAWVDYTDISLSEASEEYVLQIWNEHFQQVARIVSGLTSPTFDYTAAMQVTDFGATQQTIFVSVGQVGAYELGIQTSAEIPGGGASNDAPIDPQNPYNNPPPQTGSGGCSGTVVNSTIDWIDVPGPLPPLPMPRPFVGSTKPGPLGNLECVAVGETNFNIDVWVYEPVETPAYPIDPLPPSQLVTNGFEKGNLNRFWNVSLNIGDVTPSNASSGPNFGGAGKTWVIAFTTSSIVTGRGMIQVYNDSTAGASGKFGGFLTTQPCGVPLAPTVERLPKTTPMQFPFYMTGNPSPSTIPTLLPSTTYYVCVTAPANIAAGLLASLSVPPG